MVKRIFFLLAIATLWGQSDCVLAQGANPFDIGRKNVEVKDSSSINIGSSANPFDIKKPAVSQAVIPPKPEKKPAISEGKKEKQSAEVSDSKGPFLFGVILTMLIFLALMLTLLRPFVGKVFKGFFNDNLLNQLHREQGAIIGIPYRLLYLLFITNAGIFLYLLLKNFGIYFSQNHWYNLLLSIGLIMAIFFIKHTVVSILGWLFPIEKEMKVYNFTITVFNIVIGILLVPFNVAIAYGPPEMVEAAIWGGIGLLGLIYLFRSLRGLFVGARFLAFHKLHFLLYLCAVEIAPVAVAIKWIIMKAGG